jgi:hypothetical protein
MVVNLPALSSGPNGPSPYVAPFTGTVATVDSRRHWGHPGTFRFNYLLHFNE